MPNAEYRVPNAPLFGIRVRRALLLLCAASLVWGVVVALTGGATFRVGPVPVRSHSPLNVFLIALAAAGAALAIPTHHRWESFRGDAARFVNPVWLAVGTGTALYAFQWAAARPLWLDEEMIALNIRERGLADLAGGLWLGQSAPFGWLIAQRGALLALGDGERALRLVPVLGGIAAAGAACWIGRRWLRLAAATLLVLLCSFGQWVSFYSLELKHYSGDIFWALFLPALGAWVLEARDRDGSHLSRRGLAWWTAAAVGQWLANGALLVTPGVAAAVFLLLAVNRGRRAAVVFAATGAVWLAAFGLHYVTAIRHALNSAYLSGYWSFALPPPGANVVELVGWIVAQAEPIAVKPGGSGLWLLFWLGAIAGFACARTRHLGVLFATVPLSAFLLAAFRLVPFYERLALWIVPSLYVGIALLLDAGLVALRQRGGRSIVTLPLAIVAVSTVGVLSGDIVRRGIDDMRRGRPADSNHLLDDRAAVGWLMAQMRPGDALLSTRLALPALWWYGRLPISDAAGAGSRTPDEVPIYEVWYEPGGPRCANDLLRSSLKGSGRALIYYGFRFDDVPKGFDDLLLQRVSEFGSLIEVRSFSTASHAAVLELHDRGSAAPAPGRQEGGCILARPAQRW